MGVVVEVEGCAQSQCLEVEGRKQGLNISTYELQCATSVDDLFLCLLLGAICHGFIKPHATHYVYELYR